MSEWNSVDDCLPSPDEYVLCCIRFKNDPEGNSQLEIETMSEHEEAFINSGVKGSQNWYVTHWMPLPEPPQ